MSTRRDVRTRGFDQGIPAVVVDHVFSASAAGALLHTVDGVLRATVPPEGFADYAEAYPACAPIIDAISGGGGAVVVDDELELGTEAERRARADAEAARRVRELADAEAERRARAEAEAERRARADAEAERRVREVAEAEAARRARQQ